MSVNARLVHLREPERCERTTGLSKSCYRSRAKAKRAIRVMMSNGWPRQYAYRCPRCEFWHLTKQEQRTGVER